MIKIFLSLAFFLVGAFCTSDHAKIREALEKAIAHPAAHAAKLHFEVARRAGLNPSER